MSKLSFYDWRYKWWYTYTNGSLETFFFEFMTDLKENINNLEMTRTYEIDDFIKIDMLKNMRRILCVKINW